MRVSVKFWRDTDIVDLTLIPESESEEALLGLLRERDPHWYEGTVAAQFASRPGIQLISGSVEAKEKT